MEQELQTRELTDAEKEVLATQLQEYTNELYTSVYSRDSKLEPGKTYTVPVKFYKVDKTNIDTAMGRSTRCVCNDR